MHFARARGAARSPRTNHAARLRVTAARPDVGVWEPKPGHTIAGAKVASGRLRRKRVTKGNCPDYIYILDIIWQACAPRARSARPRASQPAGRAALHSALPLSAWLIMIEPRPVSMAVSR